MAYLGKIYLYYITEVVICITVQFFWCGKLLTASDVQSGLPIWLFWNQILKF